MARTATRRRAEQTAVEVQLVTRAARVPRGSDFPGWIEAAGARGKGAVTVRLTGWPESRRLNERFRGKSGPTNVLAFPATAQEGAATELGDLVICLPLVQREAQQQGKRFLAHLAHLVVHGTLHLLGYDHDREPAARRMEGRETRILRQLGFPNPYRPTAGRQTPRPRGHA